MYFILEQLDLKIKLFMLALGDLHVYGSLSLQSILNYKGSCLYSIVLKDEKGTTSLGGGEGSKE